MKPELILHPGFPKCGTTSLQKLFIVENHAFAKKMNVGFIGADFKPNNGYPPVSQVMYDYEGAVAAVLKNSYEPGRYFLSNEAIISKPDFLKVLGKKFNISRAVFTMRHPALQGVSNFRYSGWLNQDFATFLKKQGDWLYNINGKYRSPISSYQNSDIPVRVCPVEEVDESFELRFLREAFDEVPSILVEPPFSTLERANASVPFAFSEALYNVLSQNEFLAPEGPERHALVIAAQNYKLPKELCLFAPASIAGLDKNKLEASTVNYSKFLREFGAGEKTVESAVAFSRKQIDQLLSQPVAGPEEEAALFKHARRLLDFELSSKNIGSSCSISVPAKPRRKPNNGWIPLPISQSKLGNSSLLIKNERLNFTVVPGKPQICRLRLQGYFNVLNGSTVICFDFHSPKYPLTPDIVIGDSGFPSIILVNADGVHFTFARGNLKDFFDISRPNTRQRIELPLNCFLYDNNMMTNVPLDGDFFAKPIVEIIFDFLRHKVDMIDIELGEFAYREAREIKLPPVQDLVVFDRSDQVRSLPKFATERDGMTFVVALNATALALGYAGAQLKLKVINGGKNVQEGAFVLSAESISVQLELKKRGAYKIYAELEKDGEALAREEWSACHVVPRDGTKPSSILGISDAAEYDRIAMAGGSWDRLVTPLALVVKKNQGFRFQSGLNSFPRTRRASGQHRILSIFEMPKHLSRLPERWDYNRYGPSDYQAYGEMIGWLAKSAHLAGFTHFEVWNEASAYGHWADDMDSLIALHKITYEIIRKVAPGMLVLGGCTHSWDLDFLRRFFESGGGEYCDGLTIHGYTYQPALLPQRFDEVEALIDGHVTPERNFGLYVTEVGFRMPAFTEMAAAENLVLFTLEAASRMRTRAVLWFRYNNPRPEVDSGYKQRSSTGYALVGNGDRYCRASYAAYRFTDLLLSESNYVEASGDGEERVYRLMGEPGTIGLATKSRRLLERIVPLSWRRVDCCGGPLMEADEVSSDLSGLFLALRPGFFV